MAIKTLIAICDATALSRCIAPCAANIDLSFDQALELPALSSRALDRL